jgi:hypothetical protein
MTVASPRTAGHRIVKVVGKVNAPDLVDREKGVGFPSVKIEEMVP